MQPARTNRNGGTPGNMHILCHDQFCTATTEVHDAQLCGGARFFELLIGCTVEGKNSFNIAIDQVNLEPGLTLHILQKFGAIAGLANCLSCHYQYLFSAVPLSQLFILTQSSNGSIPLLRRNLPARIDTLTYAYQFHLVLDNIQVIRLTASDNDMNCIAANINGRAHWSLLFMHFDSRQYDKAIRKYSSNRNRG